MLPFELVEFRDARGRSPFRRWYSDLDDRTAVRISAYLERMAQGNFSNVKGVGGGVSELKADFGPGYRVYFGIDGPTLVVLLAGGTKARQQSDIAKAQLSWSEYNRRKQRKS